MTKDSLGGAGKEGAPGAGRERNKGLRLSTGLVQKVLPIREENASICRGVNAAPAPRLVKPIITSSASIAAIAGWPYFRREEFCFIVKSRVYNLQKERSQAKLRQERRRG